MKTLFTLFLFITFPFTMTGCSCAWFSTFCQSINSESTVSSFKIIEDRRMDLKRYLDVVVIEDLLGTSSKDTMTILANHGSSCDENTSDIMKGDTIVAAINHPNSPEPYDLFFYGLCSKSYLKIINDKIDRGAFIDFPQIITYDKFKEDILLCAKASVLDNPILLDRIARIFPNPALGLLNLDLRLAEEFKYQIFDIQGRIIFQKRVFTASDQIDLSTFQKGLYFIKITVNDASVVRKFVKL